MSRLTVRAADRGHGNAEDFDLNIAPIIDCFTVLIAYLLVSATFVSLGTFDVGVSVPGEASAATSEPKPAISVQLDTSKAMEIHLTGPGLDETVRVPPNAEGERNYEGLTKGVGAIRRRLASIQDVTVTAQNQVQYKEVVKAVEALKKTVPKVLLGNN